MPWFRVDDGFHSHPKVLGTSPAALGLWVVAGSWSSAHLTEGYVPDDVLPRLVPDGVKLAEELVTSRLWRRRKGGYQFHDWLIKNPSRVSVENTRKADAERQRRSREAKLSRRDTGVTNAVSHSTPSHPGPSPGVVVDVVTQSNGSNGSAPIAVIEAIIKEIHDTTGTLIDPDWAGRIAAELVTPGVTNPAAYVRTCIRNDPNPALRFLPQYGRHARKDPS